MAPPNNSYDTSAIRALIEQLGLNGNGKKDLLRQLVREEWPPLPSFSTLEHPQISEVQTATVGTGIVLTFTDRGTHKAVVLKAGEHYKESKYMIPGGFLNLTQTPGTALAPADATKGEDPRVGAVRELEEEMRDDKGAPLLKVDPARLKPADTKTISFKNGDRRVVIGFTMELTPEEVKTVQEHVDKLEHDPVYREAVRAQTINPDSKKPEVGTVSIVKLADLASGAAPLLHADQASLFKIANENMGKKGPRIG